MARKLGGGTDNTAKKEEEAPKELSPVDSWNKVFTLLAEADEAWQEHQQVVANWQGKMETLPAFAQRCLSFATNKSKFDVMLDRMIRFARNQGGLKNLVIKEKE